MSNDPEHLPTDPLIGQWIGDYRIERELGRGGMGVVYLARHLHLDRYVAIKTLSPHALHAASARQRFVREAQALARVKVPGLVDILSVGETDEGLPFIVMEHLDGQTLDKRLKQRPDGPLALDTALLWTEQLFVTLQQLHEHRVVHRDIKPENIMLVADGAVPSGERAKILDLGIAKLLEESEPLTRTETQPGTGPYMSPEACEGSKTIDGKADVYALGCVLYELLCGRPPFTIQDGGSVMVKHIQQRPERPRTRRPDLPPAVDEFVMALLRKDPSARPGAAQAITRIQSLRNNPHQRIPLWGRVLRSFLGAHLALRIGMPLIALICLTLLMIKRAFYDAAQPVTAAEHSERREMVRIPAGSLRMGSTERELAAAKAMAGEYDRTRSGDGQRGYVDDYEKKGYLDRERPMRTVELRSFLLDQYEVTNEEFAPFLQAELDAKRVQVKTPCPLENDPRKKAEKGQCVYTLSDIPYKNLIRDRWYGGIDFVDGRFVVAPDDRKRPVVAISFHAAAAFCAARGKRLPTEPEWEYAARRGGGQFPWGDRPPGCTDAVLERSRDRFASSCVLGSTVIGLPPVGSMPTDRTIDGLYDLGGSVAEWTAENLELVLPKLKFEGELHRVLRGGAWDQSFLSARGAARFQAWQDLMHAGIGFRCARDIE